MAEEPNLEANEATEPEQPDEVHADDPVVVVADAPPVVEPKNTGLKRLAAKATASRKRKIISIVILVLVLLAALLALPWTGYALLGWAVKKDVNVTVHDSQTGRPVSDALVSVGSQSAKTNASGVAIVKSVGIGQRAVTITKSYYNKGQATVTLDLFTSNAGTGVDLQANGRQVTYTVVDKISGAVLPNAELSVGQSSAKTDGKGIGSIVLSANSAVQNGNLSLDGYVLTGVAVDPTNSSKNVYTLTPIGQIVYLSNATGTINVMRANLDGSNATAIVAGTGKENRYSTSLLSARDWKYSALKASRTSDTESMYLVTTASGDLKTIDEGDATFTSVGWAGHVFVYTVSRNVSSWTDKAAALKVYDADTGKLTTLDETSGSGTNYYDAQYQYFTSVYIIDSEIVYAKAWNIADGFFYGGQDPGKSSSLYSVDATSLKKHTVKDFPQHQSYSGLSLSLYEPQGIYVTYNDNGTTAYYEYEDGSLKTISQSNDDQYPTYLVSPSGNKTFWYELRDGKNTIFIGDKEGKNAKQIATLSDYVPYGWYGDNDQYILFTKNGSELYIAPAVGTLPSTPLKVTDYYKVQTYPGYGYGYGGQ